MKELPRPIVIFFLVLGFLLIGFMAVSLYRGDSEQTRQQYIDQLDVETRNPQPAGKNVIPE
ncbi:MAG: hypothetical protein U5L95_04530 [Candidatus Saccharibacteria bacterium]|nr:hypothetical protein [Candidatus Saccharibacteria bacterium]